MPNFEVYSFNRSGDKRKCQNSRSGSRDFNMAPFDLILHFLCYNSLPSIRLRAKFEVSSLNHSRDIMGFPKFENWVTWRPHDPIWPNFAFSSLELTAVRIRAKFKVSSFNRSRDIRGGPKIPKLGHVTPTWPLTWPPYDPFWPNFVFSSLVLTAFRLRAKFEVSSFDRSRDIRRSQNSKTGSRDPRMTPFDLILHFLR